MSCGKLASYIIFFLLGHSLPPCHGQTECDEYRRIISSRRGIISLTLNPKPLYYQSYNCSNVVELIVGGEAAKHGEFPHHALLGYPREDGSPERYSFSCGGSLISDRFILTAAHCFSYGDPEIVRLGEYDLVANSTIRQDFGIAEIIRHPQYRNARSYHDVALVRLNETVLFSKVIRPACLWNNPTLNVSRFVATGFGKQEEGSIELSTKMMKVQLDLFPSSDCGELFRDNRKFRDGIDKGQLCVGSLIGGKDTCQGDSGGPLQTITEPRSCIYNIVGVTSTGAACGVGNSKAIYTNVAHYLDWIEQVVWECEEYRQVIVSTHRIIHLLINPTPREFQVFDCDYGKKLIAGGQQADYGEFPHQAVLGYWKVDNPIQYKFHCGGTLISEQHVLTAAHCVSPVQPVVVRLGEYDIRTPSDDELELWVERVLEHPKYATRRPYYDIALIRLERPVQLTKLIRPACLWTTTEHPFDHLIASCWHVCHALNTSGFGKRNSSDTEPSPKQRKVQLRQFPRKNCSRIFENLYHETLPGELCFGSNGEGKDTCRGDSGGPLQLMTNETTCTFHLVGVTASGAFCGDRISIGIYTDVAYYLDWIEENESDDEYDSDIDSIRRHPKHLYSRSYDDIALVKLRHPIALSKHIRPACLWEGAERNTTRFIATGFGHNETYSTTLSTVLMKVQLDEFAVGECERMFRGDRYFRHGISEGQLCVGSIVEGRDTCQGDSGGPLQVVTSSNTCSYAVVGITSIGGVCGISNSKAVYTKVSHYIDWIEDNVWGANAISCRVNANNVVSSIIPKVVLVVPYERPAPLSFSVVVVVRGVVPVPSGPSVVELAQYDPVVILVVQRTVRRHLATGAAHLNLQHALHRRAGQVVLHVHTRHLEELAVPGHSIVPVDALLQHLAQLRAGNFRHHHRIAER
uniref:Peptidase S1 domain-containing protein n=1 Tax=Anopheles epiroticus TaxID=199890 RepID=A0A182P8Z8_9DIPT